MKNSQPFLRDIFFIGYCMILYMEMNMKNKAQSEKEMDMFFNWVE